MAYILPSFYSIQSSSTENEQTVFRICLNDNCPVYEGHFVGEPVCPGVMSIQMLVECASRVAQKTLYIDTIKQCRFYALMTPKEHQLITAHIQLTPQDSSLLLSASIVANEQTMLSLKALLTEQPSILS